MLTNPKSEQTGTGIQLFTNPTFGSVRTAGTSDHPLFCLVDLCKILGLDPSKVSQRLSDGVRTKHPIPDSLGREQSTTFVTESGMYKVIFQSRKPEAEAFTSWVTDEVLPAIRKTGGYIPTTADETDAEIMAKALLIAQRTREEQKQRIQILEGENQHLQLENKTLAPKAQYTDEVLQSTSTITFTEAAKELNFRSATALINRLLNDRVIYRQSGRILPTAKYSGKGFFTSRTHRFYHTDGTPDASVMTVVTQKGRAFLYNYFFGGRAAQ